MATSNAIYLQQVCMTLGGRQILRGLDLVVPAASVFGFLGNNGQGKSTTLRLITGLLSPTSGAVEVLGRDIRHERTRLLSSLGCVVDTPKFYPNLTAREFLSIATRLKRADPRDVTSLLEIADLNDTGKLPIGRFSLGMRQRLGIAHALIGRPELLILDEPTNGLDPEGMQRMRLFLRGLPQRMECTVFYTSHLLDDVERTATHVALLHNGVIAKQGRTMDLLQDATRSVTLRVADCGQAVRLLSAHGYKVRSLDDGMDRIEVDCREEAKVSAINRLLVRGDVDVLELSPPRRASLQRWYREAIGGRPDA